MGMGINIYNLDCLVGMKDLGDESVDLITTDPPYGISFMGKDWDKFNEIVDPQGAYAKKKGFKKLPRQNTASMAEFFVPIWTECLRVLKAGAFAFVMCSPRADVMAKQINALQEAGFQVNFTPIYWAYASGFPKAQNIGKAVDKRLGVPIEKHPAIDMQQGSEVGEISPNKRCAVCGLPFQSANPCKCDRSYKTITPQSKALDGSYGGFQPKPAVEVIIVAMKPLSEKTFVDQALKNRKGITWLDDCRIPYDQEPIAKRDLIKQKSYTGGQVMGSEGDEWSGNPQGRFPANLLVSDDVLNDGRITKATNRPNSDGKIYKTNTYGSGRCNMGNAPIDSGSFSRYFDLDKWWTGKVKELPESARKTFPFLIVPKASKSEKNRGISGGTGSNTYNRKCLNCSKWERKQGLSDKYTCHCEKPAWEKPLGNYHPTVKPVKLFSYLVTLGSRAGDVVLDPFGGTMTTAVACAMLGREFIGYEIDAGSYEISQGRVKAGWQIKLEALGGKE